MTNHQPSTDHRLTINRPSSDHQPTIIWPLTNHRPTINRPSTNHLPTIDRPSTNHPPTIDQPSTDHRLTSNYWLNWRRQDYEPVVPCLCKTTLILCTPVSLNSLKDFSFAKSPKQNWVFSSMSSSKKKAGLISWFDSTSFAALAPYSWP